MDRRDFIRVTAGLPLLPAGVAGARNTSIPNHQNSLAELYAQLNAIDSAIDEANEGFLNSADASAAFRQEFRNLGQSLSNGLFVDSGFVVRTDGRSHTICAGHHSWSVSAIFPAVVVSLWNCSAAQIPLNGDSRPLRRGSYVLALAPARHLLNPIAEQIPQLGWRHAMHGPGGFRFSWQLASEILDLAHVELSLLAAHPWWIVWLQKSGSRTTILFEGADARAATAAYRAAGRAAADTPHQIGKASFPREHRKDARQWVGNLDTVAGDSPQCFSFVVRQGGGTPRVLHTGNSASPLADAAPSSALSG